MDRTAYTQFTTTAAEMAVTFAKSQVELFDTIASSAKGTPVAPLFEMASQMQHSALDGFESLTSAAATKAAPKAAKSADKPLKASTKVAEKAAKKQAKTVKKATVKTATAVKKAAVSASAGDMETLYDDLTAVTGIGPSTMKKLHAEGIRTISDLAKTSTKDLKAIVEKANVRLLKYSPAELIADAKALVKAAKAA